MIKSKSYFLLFLLLVLWQTSLLPYSAVPSPYDNDIYQDSEVWMPTAPKKRTTPLSIPPMLPSKMKVHYHEMWNHSTSTIEIPEEYRNPFNISMEDKYSNARRSLTSLEILQNVLHGKKYKAEFTQVEYYMNTITKNSNTTLPVPSCLVPDLTATRNLAKRVMEARNKKRKRSKLEWTLLLPILNVGFPKVGSNTLADYFNCIGIKANHNQDGEGMFRRLSSGRGIYGKDRFYRKKNQAFCQLDTSTGIGFYPQISLLDELHEEHPHSTLIFNFRPISDWIRSTTNWYGMRSRFSKFLVPGLVLTPEQLRNNQEFHSGENKTKFLRLSKIQLAKWWCGHVLHMREYVREYPSHALIELDLYDTNGTAALMYDLFRADTDDTYLKEEEEPPSQPLREEPRESLKQCWGKRNVNSKLL